MTKTVFEDKWGNELKFHINKDNQLVIYVGQSDNVFMGNGYIHLNSDDLGEIGRASCRERV